MTTCIGQPISWLALEKHALGGGDPAIRDHLAACAACRHCLDEIERDVVALPPLVVPAGRSESAPLHRRPARRAWWRFALPAGAALAMAALLLLWLRPREPAQEGYARIKGLGDVQLDVVRERAGTVREDVRSFAPGDRWKAIVTCPLDRPIWLDVAVVEAGASRADYPLAPARVVCGNRIVVPGAFTLTGDRPHRMCVRITPADLAPTRTPPDARDACITLRPE
jgi:hypothetical protein